MLIAQGSCKKEPCVPIIVDLTAAIVLDGTISIAAGEPFSIPFIIQADGESCPNKSPIWVPATQALLTVFLEDEEQANWIPVDSFVLQIPSFEFGERYEGTFTTSILEHGNYRFVICVDEEGIVPAGTEDTCF